MADQPEFGPLGVTDFTVGAMLRAGAPGDGVAVAGAG